MPIPEKILFSSASNFICSIRFRVIQMSIISIVMNKNTGMNVRLTGFFALNHINLITLSMIMYT